MAETLPVTTDRVLTLPEYIEEVTRTVDARDLDSVRASAPALAALANNRTFFAEFLNAELRRWDTFQQDNAYISQSFILHRDENLLVRANIWTPPSETPAMRDTQDRVTFYRVAHDHNFSFLTVGYVGSGYETELFEVEPGSFRSEVGAEVSLRFIERTTLPRGKLMLYRARVDVHEQFPPEDLSISLNLMCLPPEINTVDQHYFDLESRRVAAVVGIYTDRQILLTRLAAAIGDAETDGLLEKIAATHATPRVRVAAAAARRDRLMLP